VRFPYNRESQSRTHIFILVATSDGSRIKVDTSPHFFRKTIRRKSLGARKIKIECKRTFFWKLDPKSSLRTTCRRHIHQISVCGLGCPWYFLGPIRQLRHQDEYFYRVPGVHSSHQLSERISLTESLGQITPQRIWPIHKSVRQITKSYGYSCILGLSRWFEKQSWHFDSAWAI